MFHEHLVVKYLYKLDTLLKKSFHITIFLFCISIFSKDFRDKTNMQNHENAISLIRFNLLINCLKKKRNLENDCLCLHKQVRT